MLELLAVVNAADTLLGKENAPDLGKRFVSLFCLFVVALTPKSSGTGNNSNNDTGAISKKDGKSGKKRDKFTVEHHDPESLNSPLLAEEPSGEFVGSASSSSLSFVAGAVTQLHRVRR